MALADLVVVMNGGRIEQAAPPREVFNHPASAFVARFIGGHNVIAAKLNGGSGAVLANGVAVPLARAPQLPSGTPIHVAVRADRMRIGAPDGSGTVLQGTARAIEYFGPTVQLGVDVAGLDPLSVSIAEQNFFAAPVQPGDPVAVTWAPEDVHVIER